MLADREKCTGCSACLCICEYNCIEMKSDDAGFKYPAINYSECVHCNKCESVCPVINNKTESFQNNKGYILQNKDKCKLFDSTSGAVFPEIAEYILRKRGIVFGASFGKNFYVEHIPVDDLNMLWQLKKSKYIQSDLHNSYFDVKRELDGNRLVCFSGTPCQIEGLLSFLGKEYPNLITVDVVCHGVSSPLLWEKYLQYRQDEDKIRAVCFRDKTKGYQYNQMKIQYERGAIYLQGTEYDEMLRAFFSNICDRKSCYNCQFKKVNRRSDFTIWDSFDNKSFGLNYDDNVGTSKMIIHTKKGMELFDEIKNNFYYQQIEIEKLVESSYEMTHSVENNILRSQFVEDLNTIDIKSVMKKYFPVGKRVFLIKLFREILYRCGMYAMVRRTYNTIKKSLNNVIDEVGDC